jgi:hypothetical protein
MAMSLSEDGLRILHRVLGNKKWRVYMDDEIKSLEKFILDTNIEKLEKKLREFNIFDVLQVSRRETIHSSVLKWLLDPKENHGMNDYFLKVFLKKALDLNSYKNINQELSPIIIDTLDLKNSLVETEKNLSDSRRTDISITNKDIRYYILIENKLFAGEGNEQTEEYVKQGDTLYHNYNRIYIYLTPDGHPPKSDKFLVFSYKNLLETVDSVMDVKGSEINENTKMMLSQLKLNVEVNIMKDSAIEKLCEQIYKEHKKAIDKIIDNIPTYKLKYEEFGKTVIKDLKGDWQYHCTKTFCAIYRKLWKDKCNPNANVPFVHYELEGLEGGCNLRISIHVENIKDTKVSVGVFRQAINNLYGPKKGTRVVKQIAIDSQDDTDEMLKDARNKIMKLIEKTSGEIDKALSQKLK